MPGIGLSFFDAAYLARVGLIINSPKDVPNLFTWLDAENGVRDSAGAAITVDGTEVKYWDDQAGAGLNLVEASAGQRPTWEDGEWNGRAVLRFASTDLLLVAGADRAQPQTLFFALKTNTTSYTTTICDGKATRRWTFHRDAYGRLGAWVSGGTDVPLGTNYPGVAAPILACVVFNGASSKYAVNSFTMLSLANPGTLDMNGLTIGGSTGGSAYTGMDFAELIWFGGALTDVNCCRVMMWLGMRYNVGLTGALPYGPGATDDFQSYADGNDIDTLSGGSKWNGNWVAR